MWGITDVGNNLTDITSNGIFAPNYEQSLLHHRKYQLHPNPNGGAVLRWRLQKLIGLVR